MKKLLLIFSLSLGLAAFAQQERLDQVPPPVTEREVETDARVAQQERKRNEEAAKKEREEREAAEKEKTDKQTKNTSTRKSSNTSEKQ